MHTVSSNSPLIKRARQEAVFMAPSLIDPCVAAALEALAEVERRVIEATLARHGGSVPRAARVLAVSPSTLYRKIEAWARQGA